MVSVQEHLEYLLCSVKVLQKQGAAWVYLLTAEDLGTQADRHGRELDRHGRELDRPDSDYEHSDQNTTGSSGIGSLPYDFEENKSAEAGDR